MLRAGIAGAACLVLAACGDGGAGNQAAPAAEAGAASREAPAKAGDRTGKSLLDSLSASPDLATFNKAVKAAGLAETFSGSQPYSVFAPTEAAFGKLPAGMVDSLLAPDGKARLTALLTQHVVPGTVTAEDLERAIERGKGKAQLATLGGATLGFSKEGGALVVAGPNGSSGRLSGSGAVGATGVVHPIDTVLMPQ